MTKRLSLAPLAAALALALCGSAIAATPTSATPAQQTTTTQSTSQNHQQNDNQNNMATRNMNQQAKNAYREGELWATYVVNPVLRSYKINADVSGDTATLSGTVGTHYEKLLAANLAQATAGIHTVTNHIKVNPDVVVVTLYAPASDYGQHVQNATTSARVNSLLTWNEYTDAQDIKVKTRNGKVTLTGVADTQMAKQRAKRIAANARGVTSVDNELTVRHAKSDNADNSLSDQTLSNRLQASYLYAFHVDASDLNVKVNNGKATLSGDVANNLERMRAIAIAQHTRGVTAVDASAIHVTHQPQMRSTAVTSSGS